jgi:protein-tyrosine phosphatase
MKVLFVCTANICRSPVAEHYLRRLVEQLGPGAVEIASSGTHAVGGLTADGIATRLATERGCDLTRHRSKPMLPQDVQAADRIVVMERRHRQFFAERYPEALPKVQLLLAGPDGTGGRDLADPTGGTLSDYRRCFDQLFDAIERMALSFRFPR